MLSFHLPFEPISALFTIAGSVTLYKRQAARLLAVLYMPRAQGPRHTDTITEKNYCQLTPTLCIPNSRTSLRCSIGNPTDPHQFASCYRSIYRNETLKNQYPTLRSVPSSVKTWIYSKRNNSGSHHICLRNFVKISQGVALPVCRMGLYNCCIII